jgi:hypothetical protein
MSRSFAAGLKTSQKTPISRLAVIDCWVTRTRRAAHASDGYCAPRRAVSMPVTHYEENASRWRIHYSEIDKMEVSTPRPLSSSQRISRIARSCRHQIFVFFEKNRGESENT